jgi:hypothetical protein
MSTFGFTQEFVVFVGDLPAECKDADLRAAFEVCGAIDRASVITGKDGRSKGSSLLSIPLEPSICMIQFATSVGLR